MARLTSGQLTTLKNHLAANAATVTVGGTPIAINAIGVADQSDEAAGKVRDWYNAVSAPPFKVYKPSVGWDEIMLNGMDWSRVDNLSNGGKFRIWEWMFKNTANAINPAKANIRSGINATWVGTAQDLAVRAAVYLHCFRDALVGEKLFATGTGTAANATGDGPATGGTGTDGALIVELTSQDIKDSWSAG